VVRRPPGVEIYRRELLSVYEVPGTSSPAYCSALGLFARLFACHESLYAAAVRQFNYYVLCAIDVAGACRLRGFYTKVRCHTVYSLL